jgi:hypothetical protein
MDIQIVVCEEWKQQGKEIYSLKLECHNFSYLCTKQLKYGKGGWLLSNIKSTR